jgi:hypothetical protein
VADQEKIGRDWDAGELDAIVADYFAMLDMERRGEGFVKAHRAQALMDRIGRTHRSVEFKHMNISAALTRLGLPTIKGYKPKYNLQNAIVGAIEKHLEANPRIWTPEIAATAEFAEGAMLFEEPPPPLNAAPIKRHEALERLAHKFDPAERDIRNRTLGKAGEGLVVDFERARLAGLDRPDLARKVRWVSQEDGDGLGYDIRSFDAAGRERLIEVKTTTGGRTTPFFLTRNERSLADERPDAFRLFRVYDYAAANRLFRLKPPLESAVVLEPETWRAGFG